MDTNSLQHCNSCARSGDSAPVSVAKMMWTYNCYVNSALVENSKERSSSTISTEASFNDDSNEETLNINKVCH